MQLVIDTSVFIAAWNRCESHHSQTGLFFEKVLSGEDTRIMVPELIVYEVTNVLTKLGLSQRLKDYLSVFSEAGIHIVHFNSELFDAFTHLASHIKLKTADLIVCSTAYLTKSYLISWDKKFLLQASRLVNAQSPSDWLRGG